MALIYRKFYTMESFNPRIGFSTKYGLSFISFEEYQRCESIFSGYRRDGKIDGNGYRTLTSVYFHLYQNSKKIKELDINEPRRIAQRFIGKKNIRNFIFKRDGGCCLVCDSDYKLEIDHINPISRGGLNVISNLQTLCKSCNVKKRDEYKDYRNRYLRHGKNAMV